MERTGNAYLEVLRNAQDEIVFLRHVDAKMMRLMKLDDAVPVEQALRRKGAEAKVTVSWPLTSFLSSLTSSIEKHGDQHRLDSGRRTAGPRRPAEARTSRSNRGHGGDRRADRIARAAPGQPRRRCSRSRSV